MDNHTPLKKCSKCYNEYPATTEYFYKKKTGRYGVAAHCIACHYKLTAPNSKKWRLANPDKTREACKKHYWKNHDETLEKQRAWRVNHVTETRSNSKRWKELNRTKVAAKEHRRRARIAGTGGTYNQNDVELQKRSQTDKRGKLHCWWCEKVIKEDIIHIDHRIPLSKGGDNSPGNICISCPSCNWSKGAKLPQEWRGRLL